ncbi:MAG: NADH:ubiquinone reductase (Na(+)-transporting) subunit C [Paludibacter sp.]|nr:NADH:ubiquinone reductase (Na(+)-transporting) subunit C [Paludibacter sp.]
MNTNSNGYTLVYATIMVVVVALLLAFVSSGLKETQNANVKLDKKKQILSSLDVNTEGQDADALYDQYIKKGIVVNSKGEILSETKEEAFDINVKKELSKKLEERHIPLYIAEVDGKTKYIIPLRGTGLWGPIWGYLALDDDKNTVFGTYFSHEAETPGLGANITDAPFQKQFIGKHILNDKDEFVSIAVMKAGKIATNREQVDAISGGTITSKGVEDMLSNCIGQYEEFLQHTTIGGTN